MGDRREQTGNGQRREVAGGGGRGGWRECDVLHALSCRRTQYLQCALLLTRLTVTSETTP